MSPAKIEKKKGNVKLDIADIEFVEEDSSTLLDEPGQPLHLKQYQKQAKQETINAIKGIIKDR